MHTKIINYWNKFKRKRKTRNERKQLRNIHAETTETPDVISNS